eukprot:TRINITY_DN90573_c0_g1_i1.p1 TRINITY_DN90573_c0_g1~~TRINITY_DN90573_c0_g1_i1.p1  ORF type:complete len:1913 (-),score=285.46 TRINITY_DN90573_c0_g1_i1:313-5601(-)
MSSSEFKCSTQDEEDTRNGVVPFYSPVFNDSGWDYAFEQPDDCCPWRETTAWNRMNARWIGLDPRTFGPNISGPRQYYCRYIVPGNDTSTRLPLLETEFADATAPVINLTEIKVSTSMSQVKFTVDKVANVYCGQIDARYVLRPPTHNELKNWGTASLNVPGPSVGFEDFGEEGDEEWERREIDYPALERLIVTSDDETKGRDECGEACRDNEDCAAFSFYRIGQHLATGTNCKLYNASYNASLRLPRNDYQMFFQRYKLMKPFVQTITISGMLLPGTIYITYCSAEDPISGNHSNLTAITDASITTRTEGCFDCGKTEPPEVTVLGGWAGKDIIGIVAQASRAGRIFCNAFEKLASNTTESSPAAEIEITETTADLIRAPEFFNILTVGGKSVGVNILNLKPSTDYEVMCVAEADGGLVSVESEIAKTRRTMTTEGTTVTINSMKVSREADDGFDSEGTDRVTVSVQLTSIGYLWCNVFPTESIMALGVPDGSLLREDAGRSKITNLAQDATGIFTRLVRGMDYDVWCTAEYNNFENETVGLALESPFPIVQIYDVEVFYTKLVITTQVSKGPATLYCQAFPWALRPTTERPEPADQNTMSRSPVRVDVHEKWGGYVVLEIAGLITGMYYDLYCYSEVLSPPPPPGMAPPPREGMDNDQILATRREVLMKGPLFDELGWSCVAGYNCVVDNVLGVGLTEDDRVMVRADECPGTCACNGHQDANLKGGSCSAISQDEVVLAGAGISDRKDPRGAWCYVDDGACLDQEPSTTFPELWISYRACTFNASVPGEGPPGFPNGGLLRTYGGSGGREFGWGDEIIVAPGATYSLCWCNGTESSCTTQGDFRQRLGPLHYGGPTAAQAQTTMTCRVGLPCVIQGFDGHALINGSRLVVLPEDPRGCLWEKASPADPPGLDYFPNMGVSETFNVTSREYHYFSVPLIVPGGSYNLCWCGPPRQGMVKAPGKEYRMPDGTWPPECPSARPEQGGKFLAPAGKLRAIGPVPRDTSYCKLGVECILPDVQGEGLSGSDRLIVAETCGEPAKTPLGWSEGPDDLDGWTSAGWMTHGPVLSHEMLLSFGVPGVVAAGDSNSSNDSSDSSTPEVSISLNCANATNSSNCTDNVTDRGVYGFPNRGMTVHYPIPGYFSWGGPTWAFAGTYVLCWCGADATTTGCSRTSDYLAPVGRLVLTGPSVLPLAAQMHLCVRGRRCEILRFAGTTPPASRLFFASEECGTPAPFGMPNGGESLPSPDGFNYRWGDDPIQANPGRYRICWCATVLCRNYRDFLSYGGLLQVKAPTESPLLFFCELGRPCNISGIFGEGLNAGDKVMALAECGSGAADEFGFTAGAMSVATYEGGSIYELPSTQQAGVYQVCWCAAEQMCRSPFDFTVDLGRVDVGGPDVDVTYRCFEWEPCEIPYLDGLALNDGDRLIAVPDGTDCRQYDIESPPPFQSGFPNSGVALPATDEGRRHSWGNGLIRAAPGIYALCWCSNSSMPEGCTERGPFNVPGGVVRVGNSKEYQFVTRPEDPPEREGEVNLGILLAIPLPVLMCGAICLGIRRFREMRGANEPEAPPLFIRRSGPSGEQQADEFRSVQVKEVMETRSTVLNLIEESQKKGALNNALMALYGKLKKTKVQHQIDLEYEEDRARRMLALQLQEQRELGLDPEDGRGTFSKDAPPSANNSEDGRGNSKLSKQKGSLLLSTSKERLPEPPNTTFTSLKSPKLFEILDLEDLEETDHRQAKSKSKAKESKRSQDSSDSEDWDPNT